MQPNGQGASNMIHRATVIGNDFKAHHWHYTDGETVVTYYNVDSSSQSLIYTFDTSPRYTSPRAYVETFVKNVGVWPIPTDLWTTE